MNELPEISHGKKDDESKGCKKKAVSVRNLLKGMWKIIFCRLSNFES